MADTTAQQTDVTASKRPKFVRQLSKSFEKTKESMKRNLLTPRGPKTARSASTELPLPETRTSTDISAPQIAPASAPAAQKVTLGEAQTIKVDIKATHDATSPVELLVKPAEEGVKTPEVHEAPAPKAVATAPAEKPSAPAVNPTAERAPAPKAIATAPAEKALAPAMNPTAERAPAPKAVATAPAEKLSAPAVNPTAEKPPAVKPSAEKPSAVKLPDHAAATAEEAPAPETPTPQPEEAPKAVQKEAPSLAADSTSAVAAVEDIADVEDLPEEPMTKIDMMPADISCTPPAVSVTINGEPINAEEPKTASQASTPAPAQEKKRNSLRRAFIGLVAVAAASAAAVAARR